MVEGVQQEATEATGSQVIYSSQRRGLLSERNHVSSTGFGALVGAGGSGNGGDDVHGSSGNFRAPECRVAELIKVPFTLSHRLGDLEGVCILGPGGLPRPAVLVNCACYSALRGALEKEAPLYARRGYAYVLVWQVGCREAVADRVFLRWRADAEALLDWLGLQPWCNGRVGTHGLSLMGSTSFAAMQVSAESDAPSTRARVFAASPTISFSRIQPTVYLRGHGLAIELVLRFLWLAEVGVREGALRGAPYAWNMFAFFLLKNFPGLLKASVGRPISHADEALWGRANSLFRGGMMCRLAAEPFWSHEGRDVQCDLAGLGSQCPPLQIITGWWDIFLEQAFDDFNAATQARGDKGGVQLTVFCGGHFGVGRRAREFSGDVLSWYDEHLKGLPAAQHRKAVRLEVFGGEPLEFLECETWPPPAGEMLELFLHSGGGRPKCGILAVHPPVSTASPVSYTYDPTNPTPYAGAGWLNLRKDGAKEQRDVELRDDVLLFTSPLVTRSMDIVGPVRTVFHVRSSASECDFVARLCVVRDPAPWNLRTWFTRRRYGRSFNLCENVARTSFNVEGVKSASDGSVRVELELGAVCCRIRVGEQLRLHICSGAHPKFLRHPLNPAGDWLGGSELGPPAKQEVLIDPMRPCSVKLPLRVPLAAPPFDDIVGLGGAQAGEAV
mmetsp:Transcript_115667/g.327045  ORF Transcript_115667/g.327045 Transcript_115667/m.327045 type:complete len:670 (+) Transcript_115667:267-2276(+)|eukprot:CAMPEP_0117480136 /NCGR_PEP_ID=MMETSP0784-20121206/12239_1 /TAXON_ID=39447 /ORGANISM="" /LENGTH=669 /DNA_ID=CAMNT_0005274573 /DNA_START=166 /DNA_END=2175 /DNA_ORIENTATION=+